MRPGRGWDWDTEAATRDFERRYSSKRRGQIERKLDELVAHGKGDVESVKGHPPLLRLKIPPDRVIFYRGKETGMLWVVSVEPRGKGTYDL